MDKLGQIISLGQQILKQWEEFKYCQNQSQRLRDHVSGLLQVLQWLQDQGTRNLSPEITAVLDNFQNALEKAMEKMEKFNTQTIFRKVLMPGSNKILFKEVNQMLRDVWEVFMLQLQIDQHVCISSISKGEFWPQEDQSDAEKDRQFLLAFQSLKEVKLGVFFLRGSSPQFCMVMEYCECRSLRDVLDEDRNLQLGLRILLALGAAKGFYWLHHSGGPHLQRNISSSSFLVTKSYGSEGFELREAQTSISQKIKETKTAYISPQRLNNPFHKYDIKAEIYSFGIVLWEIATGRIPFEGCNSKEICQLVCEKQLQQMRSKDCSPLLQEVIDECQAYEPSAWPSMDSKALPTERGMSPVFLSQL
ncbi:Mixed lineage kinase domain-like protein [Heterocephalus glaber]|uniref:Mixed lineage kinase domain-like protein n=1 Tax=Heterocephalus glaber TaxID=10181 RepID=G5B5W9_HETGA|nr:Mixed lineage kinase domain-like protein [Heterocephalus glaber]